MLLHQKVLICSTLNKSPAIELVSEVLWGTQKEDLLLRKGLWQEQVQPYALLSDLSLPGAESTSHFMRMLLESG